MHNTYLMTHIELNEKKKKKFYLIYILTIVYIHEWYDTLICIVYIVVPGDT